MIFKPYSINNQGIKDFLMKKPIMLIFFGHGVNFTSVSDPPLVHDENGFDHKLWVRSEKL
jgi:hypothetical protein